MNKTGILKDIRFMEHEMGFHHPESPQRLEVIYEMLEGPEMKGNFFHIPARRAEKNELIRVHSPGYVDRIAETENQDPTFLDPDTQTSAGSYNAALLAAGGLCEAISMVNSRELDNAFALVRPPGHHAEKNRAMGFCLFNNVAVGAKFAQEDLGLNRILIVDWDLHHGNGTQHSFENDPSILYFSSHQYPYYPGSGNFNEVGIGKGEGFTVNVPLSMGFGDEEFISIFEEVLRSIAIEYDPDMILVSAGFDIHGNDPLGGMSVTPRGFAGMTRSLMEIASKCCHGKLVLTLEGGYDLDGLSSSVKEVLRELSGLTQTDITGFMKKADKHKVDYAIRPVMETQHQYWSKLSA